MLLRMVTDALLAESEDLELSGFAAGRRGWFRFGSRRRLERRYCSRQRGCCCCAKSLPGRSGPTGAPRSRFALEAFGYPILLQNLSCASRSSCVRSTRLAWIVANLAAQHDECETPCIQAYPGAVSLIKFCSIGRG